MRVSGWSMGLGAVALAACQGEAPAPEASASATPVAASTELVGPEVRVLAFGDSLFAGFGLADQGPGWMRWWDQHVRGKGKE